MTEVIESIKSQVLGLPTADRVELVSFLLDSLEPDDETEQEWRAEISRRVADIRSGRAVGRPLEGGLAELRERYPHYDLPQDLRDLTP